MYVTQYCCYYYYYMPMRVTLSRLHVCIIFLTLTLSFYEFFFLFFSLFFSRYESVRVRSERNRTQRTERMRSSSARSQAGQGRDGPKTMTRCREEATERDIRARAITGSQRFGCWDSMSIYAREGCMISLSGDRGGMYYYRSRVSRRSYYATARPYYAIYVLKLDQSKVVASIGG